MTVRAGQAGVILYIYLPHGYDEEYTVYSIQYIGATVRVLL